MSISLIIKAALETLEVGQFIDKKAKVKELFGKANHKPFTRNFDVQFNAAKKLMPNKKFRTAENKITRIL